MNPESGREELPQVEVARVFLLQSKSIGKIKKEIERIINAGGSFAEAIKGLSLTEAQLLEKGQESTENPGQVMPVGGKKDPLKDKNLFSTAAREVFEETNLRAFSLWSLGQMEYKLKHTQGPRLIEATFYVGDLAPSDTFYKTNPEEDKIEDFVSYDLESLAEFWGKGVSASGEKTSQLLDSLLPSSAKEQLSSEPVGSQFKSEFDIEEEVKMWKMMGNLGKQMRTREAEKKIFLLKHLVNILPLNAKEKEYWQAALEVMEEKKEILGEVPREAVEDGETVEDDQGGRKETGYAEYQYIEESFNSFFEYFAAREDLKDKFYQALRLSNLEEEIEWSGNSEAEAILRLLYVIGSEQDVEAEAVVRFALRKKSHLRHFIERFTDFISICSAELLGRVQAGEIEEGNDGTQSLRQIYAKLLEQLDTSAPEGSEEGALFNLDPQKESFLRRAMYKAWIEPEFLKIPDEKFSDQLSDKQIYNFVGDRMGEIHNFFRTMARSVGEVLPVASRFGEIEELNEIASASLQQLLQYAFLSPKTKEKIEHKKQKIRQKMEQKGATEESVEKEINKLIHSYEQIVFEARRALVYLWLSTETSRHFHEMVRKTNAPIEALWSEGEESIISEPGEKAEVSYFYKVLSDGRFELAEAVFEGDSTEAPEEKDDSAQTVDHYVITKRQINLNGKEYTAFVDTRSKDLLSALRKKMVRGNVAAQPVDIFGRVIVLNIPPQEVRRETRSMTFTDSKNKQQTIKRNDVVQVFEIIDALEKEVAELNKEHQTNWQINIGAFSSTPPEPGGRIASLGPGGGGVVRFSKFIIELISPEGERYFEEVQVFTPTSDGKSAFFYYQQKRLDDVRYQIERLLDPVNPDGLRSFTELNWPHAIYGEVVRAVARKEALRKLLAKKRK
jgi:hypothetical protein